MTDNDIKKFNEFVERTIRVDGTCKIPHALSRPSFKSRQESMAWHPPTRIAVFEAARYKADGSIDGFIGWWDDDHSQMTHAATPYQVFCDMP